MTTRISRSGTYEVRLAGHLDAHWAERLDVRELVHATDGTTVLRGAISDQAALHGLLQRIRDLNVTLIAVTFVPDPLSN